MKKTSKAYFNRFKKSFLEWQQRFGLTQYVAYFFQTHLDNAYAEIEIREEGKLAVVTLANSLSPKNWEVDPGPEAHGKHEAIHLLTHRLLWLGQSRYIERSDMDEEWEALVRRLEKVL